MAAVVEIPVLLDLCAGIGGSEADCEALAARQNCLEPLACPPAMQDIVPLRTLTQQLNKAEHEFNEDEKPVKLLADIACPSPAMRIRAGSSRMKSPASTWLSKHISQKHKSCRVTKTGQSPGIKPQGYAIITTREGCADKVSGPYWP